MPPSENAFRGLAAVDLVIGDVLAKGAGVVPNAMRRGDLPAGQAGITFRWGRPGHGAKFRGGSGLSHIIAKHGVEVMEEVVETIARGRIVRLPDSPNRVLLENGDDITVLRLTRDGKRESWLLTGYERKRPDLNFNLRELTGPLFFRRR